MKEVVLHSVRNKKNSNSFDSNKTGPIITNGHTEHHSAPSNQDKFPSNGNPAKNTKPFTDSSLSNGDHGDSDHGNGIHSNDSLDLRNHSGDDSPLLLKAVGRRLSSKRKERIKVAKKQLENDIACMKLQLTENQLKLVLELQHVHVRVHTMYRIKYTCSLCINFISLFFSFPIVVI